MLEKQIRRKRRHKKIRFKIKGTAKRPRLCVFRSNRHIYAQLIDDEKGRVLIGVSDMMCKKRGKTTKTEKAREVGRLIAQKAREMNIKKVIFDRGGFLYHGRVKALAEGARDEGLEF